MRNRQPAVPVSPAGFASSIKVLELAGQSTPVSSGGNICIGKMADEGFDIDLAQLKEIEQDVRDLIDDLRVSEVNVWRTQFVNNDLKNIWGLATKFRTGVRAFKTKYKGALTETVGSALDHQVTKLLDEARKHAFDITNKAQEINPIKSMTEFEKKSLAVQEKSAELQEQALKEQQQVTQEQRDLQAEAANVKKAEEMAKTNLCYEKVLNGTSQLAVDVQPSEDVDWSSVGDDAVKKAMKAKKQWVKRLENMDDEFLKYKTLVSTWSPESLDDSQSDFKKLEEQLDIVRTAVEKAVKDVEKEDNKRKRSSGTKSGLTPEAKRRGRLRLESMMLAMSHRWNCSALPRRPRSRRKFKFTVGKIQQQKKNIT